jgi:hypothetical protein
VYWSDIFVERSRRTLRQFAGLWTVFLTGLACWQGFVHGRVALAVVLAALAWTVGPLGLVWPQAIRPVFVACMVVTFPVGWVVSRLALAGLYYLAFTPVALLFRLIGRDALARRYRPELQTYWEPKPQPAGAQSYLRQF